MRDWLFNSRKEKDLTQAQIAERIGITESYYCMIENGDRQKRMDITLVAKLSEILDIPIAEIAELEKEYQSTPVSDWVREEDSFGRTGIENELEQSTE